MLSWFHSFWLRSLRWEAKKQEFHSELFKLHAVACLISSIVEVGFCGHIIQQQREIAIHQNKCQQHRKCFGEICYESVVNPVLQL